MKGARRRRVVLVVAMHAMACMAFVAPAAAADAPPLLLASIEASQSDVSRYLVSEKLDGIRAYWDGQRLLTRNGHPILAPAWFVAGFPAFPLDGELWIARGAFDRLSATVRRATPDDDEWRAVQYRVFELPQAPGSFRDRVALLGERIAAAGVPWLQVVPQRQFTSHAALERWLDEIVAAGGEGLMLHRADAEYVTGRSDVLQKMKRWRDAEATVVGHQPGKGKFAGRLGALRVRTPDGIEFMLGTGLSHAERLSPPPLGSTVTYRFHSLNRSGKPRFASFHRRQEF